MLKPDTLRVIRLPLSAVVTMLVMLGWYHGLGRMGGWGRLGAKRTQKEAREVAVYCAPHAGVAALSVAAHAVWPGWPPGLSWPQPLLPLSPLLALSPPEGQSMPVFPAVTFKRALERAFVGHEI